MLREVNKVGRPDLPYERFPMPGQRQARLLEQPFGDATDEGSAGMRFRSGNDL